MRIFPDELRVVGGLSPAALASFVAFRDTLTAGHQVHEFVKDSSINFYVGSGRDQVFVCLIECAEPAARLWLHRRGKLAERMDLDAAVAGMAQQAGGRLAVARTRTWYRLLFSLEPEPAALVARLILAHVVAALHE